MQPFFFKNAWFEDNGNAVLTCYEDYCNNSAIIFFLQYFKSEKDWTYQTQIIIH